MIKLTSPVVLIALVVAPFIAYSDGLPIIHDAHIHYDQDMWQMLSPADALRMIRDENIQRALVSATPTEGAEKLYRQDPELVIPMLRPYKSWRHRYLWFKDPDLKKYLLAHMQRVPYRGFGEFHVFGKDAGTTQMGEMIELARRHKFVLHPHTDLEGIRLILGKANDIVVMWAHGGFDVPVDILRNLLKQYPKLYIELSFREGMLDAEQQLTSEWRAFLVNYRSRFLVGMDTYKPSQWADLPEIAAEARHWLKQLPADVAVDIARNNLDRLFPY
ncbi:MAG: hypothetical protein OQL06_13570 [Gammaproteobacteria bacterium]|nr:hypothetical protein [Gammaproteobacteria bacterium]